MNGATSPTGDVHPGSIMYEDRVQDRTWIARAEDTPQLAAWLQVGEAWKPIVRVEISGAGNQRHVLKFGPDDEFLESSTVRVGAD